MKLTKTQEEFINRVLKIEEQLKEKLWLRMDKDSGKWIMATKEDHWTGFFLHSKTVKSLTDKNILTNEKYKNEHGVSLTGMTLNKEYIL